MKKYKKYFDLIQDNGFSVGKEKGKLKPCSEINCGDCEFNLHKCTEELLIFLLEDDEIELNDIVEVVDNGTSYTTYTEWIEKNVSSKLHRYCYDINHKPSNEMKCKVICKAKAIYRDEMLYYIKDLTTDRCYLISEKGIKKVQ